MRLVMPESSSPSVDQLKRAIAIAEQIQRLESELASLLGGESRGSSAAASSPAVTRSKPGRKKRTMSPEARARIAEAQRARWAKTKRQAR
jgi:hypothetical protein